MVLICRSLRLSLACPPAVPAGIRPSCGVSAPPFLQSGRTTLFSSFLLMKALMVSRGGQPVRQRPPPRSPRTPRSRCAPAAIPVQVPESRCFFLGPLDLNLFLALA